MAGIQTRQVKIDLNELRQNKFFIALFRSVIICIFIYSIASTKALIFYLISALISKILLAFAELTQRISTPPSSIVECIPKARVGSISVI